MQSPTHRPRASPMPPATCLSHRFFSFSSNQPFAHAETDWRLQTWLLNSSHPRRTFYTSTQSSHAAGGQEVLVWLVGSAKQFSWKKQECQHKMTQHDSKNLKGNQDSCEFGTLNTQRQELNGNKCYSWLQLRLWLCRLRALCLNSSRTERGGDL